MKINLTPYSIENSLEISQEDYGNLVHIKKKGWSNCSSKEEFMAKLHYLRSGFYKGKIGKVEFCELEKKIILNYWNTGT